MSENDLNLKTHEADYTACKRHCMATDAVYNSTGTSDFTYSITPSHTCSNLLFTPNPINAASKPDRRVPRASGIINIAGPTVWRRAVAKLNRSIVQTEVFNVESKQKQNKEEDCSDY